MLMHTYTHDGILLSHNEGNLTICNNMSRPRRFILSEISRELHRPHAFIFTQTLKIRANKTKWKQTHRYKEQKGGCCGEGGLNGWSSTSTDFRKSGGCNLHHGDYSKTYRSIFWKLPRDYILKVLITRKTIFCNFYSDRW